MLFVKIVWGHCNEWLRHICLPLSSRQSDMSWGFHASKLWLVVIGQIVNHPPNLEVCMCFQKLKQTMHEALIHIQYTNVCAIYKK